MSQNDSFLTLFSLYGRPLPEGPKRLFSDFFVILGPKGPKGSVARLRVLNSRNFEMTHVRSSQGSVAPPSPEEMITKTL